MLHPDEIKRYQKQLAIPEWDMESQLRLQAAHVLVIGAGGLGVTVIPYLAAAGVGRLTLVDHDVVELSNLGRQTIYRTDQLGQSKVLATKSYIEALNPHIHVEALVEKFTLTNHRLVESADLVIDCTDNFETRYLINDACVRYGKAFVYAAIHTWEGQLAVCNAFGTGPTYRCLFPEEPTAGEIPNCNEVGVLGFLPGVLGLMQAKEAIFYLAGLSSPAHEQLIRFDVRSMRMHSFRMERLSDAAERIFPAKEQTLPLEMDATAAHAALQTGKIHFVIDVREPFEWELASLDGTINMPMNQLQINQIPKDRPGLVMCHHGMRSMYVIRHLQAQGFDKLINLTGGIDAWSREVDESVPRY